MNAFEYSFTFYSLLLGLALANLATGAAEVWRDRVGIRWGICTPLLALAVLSFCVGQWNTMWLTQRVVSMSPLLLLSMLSSTLPLIFISQAMFPKETTRWRSLDEYYLEHRIALLGMLTIAPSVAIAFNAIIYGDFSTDPVIRSIMTIIIPAAAMPFRNRWVHGAALAIVSTYYVLFRLLNF
jgi:hypothetical protein